MAFHWRSDRMDDARARDFGARKLFVHMLDRGGTRVGQIDVELRRAAGEATLRTQGFVAMADLAISETALPGPTHLAIGLYDGSTGRRYSFATGDTLEVDGPTIIR